MSRQTHREDELKKQFLLGELSNEETTALEERFFEDDDVFEELEIAEEELIELYLDDRLPANERISFERRLAGSKGLRQRVVFARALANRVAVSSPSPAPITTPVSPVSWLERLFGSRPAVRMALVAAMLIIVLGSVAWLVRKSRLEAETLEAQRLEEQRILNEQLRELQRKEEASLQSPTPTPAVLPSETGGRTGIVKYAFVRLTPGGSRDTTGAVNKLDISPGVERARLAFALEDSSYTNYHIEFHGLQTGTNLSRDASLNKESNQILVELLLTQLPPDDYRIEVKGVSSNGTKELVGNYSLFVRRK